MSGRSQRQAKLPLRRSVREKLYALSLLRITPTLPAPHQHLSVLVLPSKKTAPALAQIRAMQRGERRKKTRIGNLFASHKPWQSG